MQNFGRVRLAMNEKFIGRVGISCQILKRREKWDSMT